MRQVPTYLFIGNGRISRHFQHYFDQLGLIYFVWQRSDGIESLPRLLVQTTHVLVLINDSAIEAFITTTLKQSAQIHIHFSGSLATDLAYGAHPLMTFSHDLYEIEKYREIPFVLDEDAPAFSELLPGLPNAHYRLSKQQKAKYHALCVLSGTLVVCCGINYLMISKVN